MFEFEERPWGRFDVLLKDNGFKVKKIVVNPGCRLSYQSHSRRTEVWVVVSGEASVTLDGVVTALKRGDSITIPLGARHRVANSGPNPLVLIEVQNGEYLEEDDIERFEDDFGRS